MKRTSMKAWLVREKGEFCATVIFAETRGKAKVIAMHTDCCEDARFTEIEATRMKSADKYYKKGMRYLDWEDPKDRVVLVKNCNFTCDYFDPNECNRCSASKYCDQYKEFTRENKEVEEK